ncbi:MAG: hypothetical protein ACR2RV_19085 [Verrucomicrobiales bacterium]
MNRSLGKYDVGQESPARSKLDEMEARNLAMSSEQLRRAARPTRLSQEVRRLLPVLALVSLFIPGCRQGEEGGAGTASSLEDHQEIVAEFQDGQRRFKEAIATVRDEKSFDAAKPELDRIVSDLRDVAAELGELQPPSEEEQAKFRDMIAEGHRATEPTGEDMLSLLSIESREAAVIQWLEEFAAAAGAAGVELGRLYGQTDYGEAEEEPALPDLSNATIDGLPIDQWLGEPAASIPRSREEGQIEGGALPLQGDPAVPQD